MQQRLSLITLGVDNLAATRTFYEEKLGWTATPSSKENVVFFQLNGFFLGLFSREALAEDATVDAAGTGFKGFTLAHNLSSREEVDALFAELKGKGVKIVKPPHEVFWGGYSGYFADNEGNLWEVAHNPFMVIDEAGNIWEK